MYILPAYWTFVQWMIYAQRKWEKFSWPEQGSENVMKFVLLPLCFFFFLGIFFRLTVDCTMSRFLRSVPGKNVYFWGGISWFTSSFCLEFYLYIIHWEYCGSLVTNQNAFLQSRVRSRRILSSPQIINGRVATTGSAEDLKIIIKIWEHN